MWNTEAFADRTLITGFEAGGGGDKISIRASNTTANTDASTTPTIGFISAPLNGNTTLNLTTNDIFEFAFESTAGPLSTADAALNFLNSLSQNGAHVPSVTANAQGYFVAYADGAAAVFHVQSDATPALGQAEISLVGVLSGIPVGGLDASNFDLF